MTILNITVTPELVAISADSAVAELVGPPLEGAATTDPAELPRDFADPASPCFPPIPECYRRKIAVLAEQRRIVAASGSALLTVVATGILALWGSGSLEDELGELVAGLRKLRELASPAAAAGMVIVAGYDDALGAAAFALGSGEDWAPRKLQPGTAAVPVPHPTLAGYADLYRRYVARPGTDVEGLHLALAQNQAEAARRGLYRAGPAIGGELWLAEVDAAGARQRVVWNLG
ncbi:MAG: hypothetical protein AB7I59_05455 [Geminicoccaceae bacterium]